MSTPQSDAPVIVQMTGGLGQLTLNRPHTLNALSIDMIEIMLVALRGWISDPDVSAVLIDAAGDRGLCAGGDVRAVRESLIGGRPDEALHFFREEYALDLLIHEYPKPVVVFADGITMGGGIGLSGHAAVRVVTERSQLAMPETRIGFTPDVGGSLLLARAPGRIGEYLGLTGVAMNAADAIWAGFADQLVPSDRLPSALDALRHRADPGTPIELLMLFDETPERSRLEDAREWIDDAFSRDTVGEIVDRLREIGGDAAATADLLGELSPSSLAVTLASIRAARASDDLRAVLEQEFHVGAFLSGRPDMAEGIRAQLVDKDRSPRWSPATIAELPAGLGEEALAFRAPTALFS
ncbi:enoyl-CoA hydratase/isomerase family protein [Microbacterium gorillae]|uniref:enoyl-CoA hydratase/isomerase family protein n=1 Tax=Microbacterium gorillae TaxID=1231063 RepID=UPI003D96C14A